MNAGHRGASEQAAHILDTNLFQRYYIVVGTSRFCLLYWAFVSCTSGNFSALFPIHHESTFNTPKRARFTVWQTLCR